MALLIFSVKIKKSVSTIIKKSLPRHGKAFCSHRETFYAVRFIDKKLL